MVWVWKTRVNKSPDKCVYLNCLSANSDCMNSYWGQYFWTTPSGLSNRTYSNAFPWIKMFLFGAKISLKFIAKSLIDNKPALVLVIAWCQTVTSYYLDQLWPILLICLTWLRLINSLWLSDAIWWQKTCVNIGSDNGLLPDGTKPLSEPMLTFHQRYSVAFT